jgi:hypothetical protein
MTPNQASIPGGPRFHVYVRYSELYSKASPEDLWNSLQSVPVTDTIRILAWINSKLAADRSAQAHRQLAGLFLAPETAARLVAIAPAPPAVPALFHRLGNLILIRNLLLYGLNRDPQSAVPAQELGRLALLQNDFVPSGPDVQGSAPLELIRASIPVWDIYNPIETPSAGRIYEILTDILSGNDPTIVSLRERIGFSSLDVDGLRLPEWVAIVFGLFAVGLKQANNQGAAVFDPQEVFKQFPRAQGLLSRFLSRRALTIPQLETELRRGQPNAREQFLRDLSDPGTIGTCLATIRQQPFLFIDDRVVILDLQFLADLLTTGMYWLIFDSFDKRQRVTFREVWGRAFELYVTRELRAFYPLSSQLLSVDVVYKDGQVDAMLDFGSSVFVFEIKSSLLTDAAKRSGDAETLAKDIERKFIKNERGEPKAVLQLARAAKAVLAGDVPAVMRPTLVYPILITDEPATECPGFNAYLNERFQQEVGGLPAIRPLNVMSIDECEQFLPYAASNAISWENLCKKRTEGPFISVGQTIYDIRQTRGIAPQISELLKAKFEKAMRDAIQLVFGATAGP